jgi:hypothetical protein
VPTVRCPACDDRIEIETDWYGRTVACPTCDRQFTPRRPGRDDREDDDRDDDRPRRRSPSWEDDDEYDRPRRTRRRERPVRKSGGGVGWVLGIIGGVLLLGCLGCGGWLVYTFTSPISYPDPWVTQSIPDGTCSVQFPRSPQSESLSDSFAGTVGTKYSVIEAVPKDAGFAFGYIDYPTDQPGLFDEAYRLEMAEITRASGATVKRETTTIVAGYPCKEAELSFGGNSRGTYRLIDLTATGRPRVLVVFVGGRNISDADQKKFLDSLKVTARK